MTTDPRETAPLAHDRSGPAGGPAVLLVHAGVADRRMWDPLLPALTETHDVVRVDLRGFGESAQAPTEAWSHHEDVLATLDALGLVRVHLVGCSLGAGVCADVALAAPSVAASLVLVAPGGSLITERTPTLAAFGAAEDEALDAGDVDAATELNLRTWVDGDRDATAVDAEVRAHVGAMQRRAFEVALSWPEQAWALETGLEPSAPERLGELALPTLVLSGAHDVDAARLAAERVAAEVPGAVAETWPDVAHLPTLERPDDAAELLVGWLARHD